MSNSDDTGTNDNCNIREQEAEEDFREGETHKREENFSEWTNIQLRRASFIAWEPASSDFVMDVRSQSLTRRHSFSSWNLISGVWDYGTSIQYWIHRRMETMKQSPDD